MTQERPGEAAGFRDEVRAFLRDNLPADWAGVGALPAPQRREFVGRWRRLIGQARLIGVTWPVEYGGRGLTKIDHLVVVEEFSRAGVPVGTPGDTVSVKLIGNTLAVWGTHDQKSRFLPRIISGEDVWCQGYSEPEAGSDLASLRTRATLDGDQWHIDGQKIWTSNASNANWMFLLARTQPDAPKTKGISMLLMPMDQPGVDVRPITMLNGAKEFCEVFFNDARTAADLVVGEVNDGWRVANSLLSHERGEEAAVNPILFAHELGRVFEMAKQRGADQQPGTRERLGRAYLGVAVMKAMGEKILASYMRDGTLGPEASVSKLYWSEYHQGTTRLAVDILGRDALYWEGDIPMRFYRADDAGAPNDSSSWLSVHLCNAMAGTIYAGTSEIQRNIIAERILGLPRETRAT
ncbi:acyl-CoA dehydrogenase [Mycobacterium europaeum]|uniref:Acyl-CoA dehydrogenase n=1 Tax=Mycobacterium europaeum TaxID=761804 RepID=A0A0U1DMW7_9MYCO|nr:acyl-CoA dehydrogenase family protein [Mycobacterium europaeum]CQD18602.1 acyl-CoA dehydrogenase [Mycobacterium europaeum]